MKFYKLETHKFFDFGFDFMAYALWTKLKIDRFCFAHSMVLFVTLALWWVWETKHKTTIHLFARISIKNEVKWNAMRVCEHGIMFDIIVYKWADDSQSSERYINVHQ